MPAFAFWYLYSTNGTDGFLLDLVRRPTESVARLAVFHAGRPPHIVRHGFAPGDLRGVPGMLGVRLATVALDAVGCRSLLPNMNVDARFALSRYRMRFVPGLVAWWFGNVADFRSCYGTLERATCEGALYEDAPLVCSTYTLDDVAHAKWLLISARRFADSDLALEICAARILGRWMSTAWVLWGGREHQLNSALDSLFHVRVGRAGEIDGAERVFTASIRRKELEIEVEARGAVDQFARLDAEGPTEIHTTLFGTCRATIGGRTHTAERTCLLELKN